MTHPYENAFPLVWMTPHQTPELNYGLSKRELFGAMAMQGLLSNSKLDGALALFGQQAVASADALIAALNEERTP